MVSCYEAGRKGFWLHRFLQAPEVTNSVVASSSIAGNRRQRRATSDAMDVRQLVRMLMRYHHGEREGWRVVHVPSVEAEDQRHLPRDLETLKQERASTTTRIASQYPLPAAVPCATAWPASARGGLRQWFASRQTAALDRGTGRAGGKRRKPPGDSGALASGRPVGRQGSAAVMLPVER